jgi:hypothetical protein
VKVHLANTGPAVDGELRITSTQQAAVLLIGSTGRTAVLPAAFLEESARAGV